MKLCVCACERCLRDSGLYVHRGRHRRDYYFVAASTMYTTYHLLAPATIRLDALHANPSCTLSCICLFAHIRYNRGTRALIHGNDAALGKQKRNAYIALNDTENPSPHDLRVLASGAAALNY